MIIAPGATSQTITIQIVDDTGLAVTGLVAATFPTTYYQRAGEALPAAITLSDLASTSASYSSGGVKEITGGYYRLDVPNAAFATASKVRIIGEASGKHIIYPPILCGVVRADNRDGDAIPASNGGSGAYVITITVNDGSTALQNATVRMTEGANTFEAATNVSGQASFSLDAATYTVSITKAGYQFTPTTLAVSGATSQTYSMSAMNITPSDPGQTTGYLTVRTAAGVAVNAATVQLQITRFANGSTGSGISDPLASGTTDSNGLVEFTGLPRQAHYRVRIGTTDDAEWYEGVTANASTTPLVNALGEAVA